MEPTYTVTQVVESYKAQCRMFNAIAKKLNPDLKLTNGLTAEDIKVVGELVSCMPRVGSRVGKSYPKQMSV